MALTKAGHWDFLYEDWIKKAILCKAGVGGSESILWDDFSEFEKTQIRGEIRALYGAFDGFCEADDD